MKLSKEFPTALQLGLGQQSDLPGSQRVDAKNWTLEPYNRWSFQRVQQLTRTGRVSRSPSPSVLSSSEQDLGAIAFTDSQGQATTIKEMLTRTWTDGFMIIHEGEVVTEQYFNGMQEDTLHLMMSCSKSMTSTLVGIAVAEGQLDPLAQLTDYIPELLGTGMAGATLQQALDMQVGVKFIEDYDDLEADWRDCEVATGFREPEPGYEGPRDMVAYMQNLQQSVGPHGDVFHYQSILTDVIGVCLERATQRNFFELFAEKIWHPVGAEQELVSIVDGAGTALFEGGFNCCLRDFSRFGQLICSGGLHDGKQCVPREWIEQCRFPGATLGDAFARSEYGEALRDHSYHNQWWVRDPMRGVIMALGIHGQALFIDPENEFVAAKFSSQPAQADIGLALDQALGFEAIIGSLAS